MTPESRRSAPVFFVDRCLGKHAVADALAAAGVRVERHDDHFRPSQADAEWLPVVGRRGWVILTKDKYIQRNQIELRALCDSGAASFVLTGGNLTGPQMGQAFLAALPTIGRFLENFPTPFVARVTSAGAVKMHLTSAGLIKKL
ncbi:MAG: hypothetical protein ACT4QC_18795 [Planctomycetaceae bacterium]